MKRQVEVVVFKKEQFDENWMPEKLIDAIEWMREQLESIPVEHRDSADIEIDSTSHYESTYALVKISYWREETDEEYRARVEIAASSEERIKRSELSELARLLDKYGVK